MRTKTANSVQKLSSVYNKVIEGNEWIPYAFSSKKMPRDASSIELILYFNHCGFLVPFGVLDNCTDKLRCYCELFSAEDAPPNNHVGYGYSLGFLRDEE